MTQWQDFLISQGATIENNQVTAFAGNDGIMANQTILADLSHIGLLQLDGEDAADFLQGQVTNDVKKLDGSNFQYAGYCTPKGRLLALFLAFAHQDHLHLQLNRELLVPILKRLKMYVMRSKVIIKDVSDDIIRLGVAGPEALSAMNTCFGAESVPQQAYALTTLAQATLLRLPSDTPRYQIYTTKDHAADIWATLSKLAKPANKAQWDYWEIQAGIPDIAPATQEAFVPQMINLDALDGINFKKGCYTGQEIVARTHYLGKVKRRTQLAHVKSEQAPQIGDEITSNNEIVGKVVRSAPAPETGYDLLAELRLEILEQGNELLWQGLALEIKPLPYLLA
ncbi:MAG: folate-binding protein YgfZ [Methylophilaceae bacterium]|nr:folate-binding protein [Methyloradius sp.]